MPWSYSKAFTIGGDGGSPLKWHELILSSVPEPHFHRLGRNIYSLHASEFRPGAPFSTFGTEHLLPACFRSSVLKVHFRRLGRNSHGSHMFREISGYLEHGTSSTPRIISNEKQSPNGLCFIVGEGDRNRNTVKALQ